MTPSSSPVIQPVAYAGHPGTGLSLVRLRALCAVVQLPPLVTAEPALPHDGCCCLAVRAVLAFAKLAHRGNALSRLRTRFLAHVRAAPALVLWAETAMAVRVA